MDGEAPEDDPSAVDGGSDSVGGSASAGRRGARKALGALRHTKLGLRRAREDGVGPVAVAAACAIPYPTRESLLDPARVAQAIVHGAGPAAALIGPPTRVTALGGGFAAQIAAWLSARGFDAQVADAALDPGVGEGGLADSVALRRALERAWGARRRPASPGVARAILDASDVFVLNLERAEVWTEPPGVAADGTGQPQLRIATVAGTRDDLRAICRLVRAHRPAATILLTFAAAPQAATYRDLSAIGAAAATRAVLRAAIDEFLREGASGVGYWPSCEILRDVFAWRANAGRMQPPEELTQAALALFGQVWCAGAGLPPLAPAWALACAVSGMLPLRMAQIVQARRPRQLRQYLAQEKLTEDPGLDAALRALGAGAIAGWHKAAG